MWRYLEIFKVIQREMSRPGHGLQIESDYHYHMPPDQMYLHVHFIFKLRLSQINRTTS